MLFGVKGRMRYFMDDRILTLGPGALLWAHTDQSHFLLSESTGFDMWVLVVAPHVLRPAILFPPRFAAGSGHPPEARQLDREAIAELYAIAATLRRSDDPALLSAGLRWWTARAWIAWRDAAKAAGLQAHPAVRRAADVLRSDVEVPLSDIAKRAGLSLSRLRRVFRSETGVGLARFRTERRLERVDAILARSPAPPLLTAALQAGFGSYSQFYRAFAAARGMNPRDYYVTSPASICRVSSTRRRVESRVVNSSTTAAK